MLNSSPLSSDFLTARQALTECGIPVVDAGSGVFCQEAVALWRRFAQPVALKAEAPGLLHKSDLGCVRLNCASEAEVIAGYKAIVQNARKAGFEPAAVIVRPMVFGIAEVFAGITDNPLYGPAVVLGLGGIFVENLDEADNGDGAAVEGRRCSHDPRSAGCPYPHRCARQRAGRHRRVRHAAGTAQPVCRLGTAGNFGALDLDPIIVRPTGEGVVAVDIAVELV